MAITLSPNPNRDHKPSPDTNTNRDRDRKLSPSPNPNLEHGARICSPGRSAKGVARSSRLRKQLSGKHERNPEIFLCVMESPGGEATVLILEIALGPLRCKRPGVLSALLDLPGTELSKSNSFTNLRSLPSLRSGVPK